MTDHQGSIPQRIGDRERDQAAEFLRDHLAEGRLSQDEFDDRLTGALTARTQADLDPLFADLPSPKPGAAVVLPQTLVSAGASARAPYPVRINSRSTTALAVGSALIWPTMIVLMIVTHGHFLFLMFLPFLLPWILGGGRHRHSHHR